MTVFAFTRDDMMGMLDSAHWPKVNKWLVRGDGIAVYENRDMSHPDLGHRKFVSYGSEHAQLEIDPPPQQLPDIGGQIGWRYQLVGIYRGGLFPTRRSSMEEVKR